MATESLKQASRTHTLRIRITDTGAGQLKVALALPASLVSVALRQGARLLPPGQTTVDVLNAIEHNDLPAPIIVEDQQHGEHIEISLE